MGDIATVWFVANEDQMRELRRVEHAAAFNPFTKQQVTREVTRFDANAAGKLPSLAEDWLLGDEVGSLLGADGLRPEVVEEDELWRMPDDLVARFAALPAAEVARAHEAWRTRKAVTHDGRIARELHRLAGEAVRRGASLWGWVEASAR